MKLTPLGKSAAKLRMAVTLMEGVKAGLSFSERRALRSARRSVRKLDDRLRTDPALMWEEKEKARV